MNGTQEPRLDEKKLYEEVRNITKAIESAVNEYRNLKKMVDILREFYRRFSEEIKELGKKLGVNDRIPINTKYFRITIYITPIAQTAYGSDYVGVKIKDSAPAWIKSILLEDEEAAYGLAILMSVNEIHEVLKQLKNNLEAVTERIKPYCEAAKTYIAEKKIEKKLDET